MWEQIFFKYMEALVALIERVLTKTSLTLARSCEKQPLIKIEYFVTANAFIKQALDITASDKFLFINLQTTKYSY